MADDAPRRESPEGAAAVLTAGAKPERWLRDHGSPTFNGELVDTETGSVLKSWP